MNLAIEAEAPPQSLTLSQAFDFAVTRSERILSAREEIHVSKGLAKQSLQRLLPNLVGGSVIGETIQWTGNLQIPLIDVSAGLSAVRAFQSVKVAEASYERQQETMLLAVAEAYLQAFMHQKRLELSARQHEISQKHYAAAQRKADLQEISKLDLKRAELLVTKTQLDYANHQASVRTSRGALADLLGCNMQVELSPVRGWELPSSMKTDDLLEEARIHRSDWKSVGISVQAAWLNSQSSLWQFMPTLQFQTGFLAPLKQDMQWQWSLNVSLPLFDGYARYGLAQTARAKWRQEKQKKQLLERGMALQIAGAKVELERAKEVLSLQKNLVEINEAALNSAQNRYQLGQATSLDLLDEQTRLFQAQKDEQEAQTKLLQSQLILRYVLGDPRKGLLNDG